MSVLRAPHSRRPARGTGVPPVITGLAGFDAFRPENSSAALDVSGLRDGTPVPRTLGGVAYLEPRRPDPDLFPDGMLELRPGNAFPVETGNAGRKTLTLVSVDETTDPDNPAVTFALEGSSEVKRLRLFEEPAASASPSRPQDNC